MAEVRGAIFDLDGTLLDTTSLWEDIDRAFFESRGLPFPDDYIDAVSSMSFEEAARYTIGRFSLPDEPRSLMAEWDDMSRRAYGTMVRLFPGAEEYLRNLRSNGVRLAVATDLDSQNAAFFNLGFLAEVNTGEEDTDTGDDTGTGTGGAEVNTEQVAPPTSGYLDTLATVQERYETMGYSCTAQ